MQPTSAKRLELPEQHCSAEALRDVGFLRSLAADLHFVRPLRRSAVHSLLFIDTNIFLDFYRVRSREAGLSILKHIDDNHSQIISTSQVEMEFKKNRQRVIVESYRALKAPDGGSFALPSILAESKQSKALKRSQKGMQDLSGKLRKRLGSVLTSPGTYDPVYRSLQRLIRSDAPTNLGRENKLRYEIRRLAWKRFVLGYPPRKDGDTSIGDAINWEWIVRCAIDTGCHVVIVTRDSDYGMVFDGKPALNDWLAQEFKERVSRKRKISLTERLSEGLKAANIKVTRAEEETEEELITLIKKWRANMEKGLGSYSGDVNTRLFLGGLWQGLTRPSEPRPKVPGLLSMLDEPPSGAEA
jgi:PIN domain